MVKRRRRNRKRRKRKRRRRKEIGVGARREREDEKKEQEEKEHAGAKSAGKKKKEEKEGKLEMKHPEGSAHSQAYTITSCLDLPGSRSSRRGLPNPHENRSSDRFSRKNIKVLQQMRMQNTFGDCRSVYYKFSRSAHLLSLLMALALVNIASCQTNTNPLVPEIDQPPNPQEEFSTVTVGCKLILLTALPPGAAFPLSWSRNGGLPSGATTRQNTTVAGSATTYYSALSFVVSASVNNNPITCNAVVPGNSGSASFNPSAGQLRTWTCVSAGASVVSPNVYWRNGQGNALITGVTHSAQITLDSYNNRQFTVTSVLNTALPPERAQYILRCILIHEYQGYSYTIEKPLQVTVLFPPQLRKQSGDIVLTTENVKQTISCIISASSPAATSVSWTKDGQPVDYSTGRYEVVSTSSPSLVISNVQKSDEGDYVCSVTNAEGTTSFETPTTLVVRYAPRISYSGGTSFQAALGASYTLPCPVDANPNATTIRWKRISATGETYINIQTEPRYTGSTAQATGLTINPVAATDQGNFACEADNDVGSGQGPTISLTVNSRPAISTPQTSVNVVEDNTVTLVCEVAPLSSLTSLTWLKDGVTLSTSDPRKYSGGTRFQPNLTIFQAGVSDVGSYACVATNPYGATTSAQITVTLNYGPRLSVVDSTVTASSGATIVLSCSVDANPPVTSLYWTRFSGGGIINSTVNPQKYSGGSAASPTLLIFGADSSDSGQYTCVGENSVGASTSNAVTVSVTDTPQVSLGSPTSLTLSEGTSQITLVCSVSANPPVTNVYWLQNGVLVDVVASPTKYQGSSIVTPSLTIRNVVRGDAGQYVCAAGNSVGTSTSQALTLSVTYQPTLTVFNQPVARSAGETISLTCDLDSNPSATDFYWVKVDLVTGSSVTINSAANPNKYFGGTLSETTLFILGAEISDSGSYRCVAVNTIGTTTSDVVDVTVTSIPTVSVSPPPSSVTEGSSQLTLTCTVTSSPAPTSVAWLKGGVTLVTSNNPSKYQGGTVVNPSLTIRNVERSDAGAYTCVVTNSVGTGSSGAVQLNVVYRPTLTVSDTSVSSGTGGTIVLRCLVDANPAITTFYWSKVGQGQINSASNPSKYSGGTVVDQSLLIFGASSADSGQYFCTATNNVGTVSSSVLSVAVTNVPTVTVSQSAISVAEGTVQYTLTCSVSATPPASDVYWIKSGSGRVDITNSGTTAQGLPKLSGGSLASPSLVIGSVDRSDAATYTCVAQNSIGSGISPSITFAVTYRPTLVVSNTDVVTEAGRSVILSCAVDAFPTISTFYWVKDGAQLNPSQNPSKYNGGTISVPNLTIFNADVTSDPGTYACVAVNSIGTTFSDPVNLVVSSKPLAELDLTVNLTQTKHMTLHCAITVNSTVTDLYWTKNGVKLMTKPEEQTWTGGNITVPDVTFNPVTPADAGVYVCVAVTKGGLSRSENITLGVVSDTLYIPIVSVRNTHMSVSEGVANATLVCSVHSKPPPLIVYWLRDGIRLDTQYDCYFGMVTEVLRRKRQQTHNKIISDELGSSVEP
ncbi:titin [Plakobranchus ocellatus]|uniref:Titin n=1 Tax=Plakobranchus ocellatus TaxID=259542 RepID=A0AAV4A3R5_9GAST|nr:titin [Plakobranchus ocellatus]